MAKKISAPKKPLIEVVKNDLDISGDFKQEMVEQMDEKDEALKTELKEKDYEIMNKFSTRLNNLSKKVFKTEVKYMMAVPKEEDETDEEYKERLKKILPKYAHDGDLGMDLTAIDVEYDEEYDRYIYHTGLYMESKREDGCLLFPRSGNAKTNAYLCNSVGLVDSFLYRGEFCLMFKNRTSIQTQAALRALVRWTAMPWYKKLFTSFVDVSVECMKELRNDVMEYAPYQKGDRIAQMVWLKFPEVTLKKTKKFTPSERGAGGFGSTGK